MKELDQAVEALETLINTAESSPYKQRDAEKSDILEAMLVDLKIVQKRYQSPQAIQAFHWANMRLVGTTI